MPLSLAEIEEYKKKLLRKAIAWYKGCHPKENVDINNRKQHQSILRQYRKNVTMYVDEDEKMYINQMIAKGDSIPSISVLDDLKNNKPLEPKSIETKSITPKPEIKTNIQITDYEKLLERLKPIEGRDKPLKDLEGFMKAMKEDDKVIREVGYEKWKEQRNVESEDVLVEEFERETGKHAYWNNKITKNFIKWKEQRT